MRSSTRIPRIKTKSKAAFSLRLNFAWLALGAALCGCTTDLQVAENFGSQIDTSPIDAGADAGVCEPVLCRGRALACANCEDDDQDGLSDAEDPDCWGACDDDETQLSSERVCPNTACFFDPDCGGGNDQECSDSTPAGCDCHGCCAVPGELFAIQLGRVPGEDNTCTSMSLLNEQDCPRCELADDCANPCTDSERCFGEP